jgi:RNA polymerase sigma factor (sigma-70 family)
LTRTDIINTILSNESYRTTCYKINKKYCDDIFQEVCEQVLTINENRLPTKEHLSFWFFCVARNIISKQGKLGYIIYKNEDYGYLYSKEDTLQEIEDKSCQDQEFDNNIDLNIIEQFMLDLDEIDNRILLYYNELGTLSKVHRATGISYEVLRKAKDRIKKFSNTLK